MKKRMLFFALALLLAAGCTAKPDAPATVVADTSVPAAPEADGGEESPVRYTNVTVAVRRGGEPVSERDVTDAAEIAAVEAIVFDALVKSAAWEGVEASELEDCVILSFDWMPDSERQTYYQYRVDGRPVLQMGETGMYTMMGGDAYLQLRRLAGLEQEDDTISVEEATALLGRQLGEADAETGNPFSFAYEERLTVEERAYYRFRVSWLVDNDHLSYLTDYLVATDGTACLEYVPEA